jgi:DNA-binding MarR family transcriptional regulator
MAQSRSFGFLLMDAARLLRKRFEQEARHLGMTSAQLQIIGRLLVQEGISQARLATLLDMEPITVCRHVDRMEAAGLVERKPDPEDRRVRLLHVTEKGRALLPHMRAVAQKVLEEAQEGLPADARATVLDALEQIVGNLSRKPQTEEPADMPKVGYAS